MKLPVFDGVREALKPHNVRRKRGLEREKQTQVKKKRVLEGCKRSELTKKHDQAGAILEKLSGGSSSRFEPHPLYIMHAQITPILLRMHIAQ